MTYQPDFKIRLRRGLLASLPTLNEGEPGFCTDSFDMYIGSSDGNKKFQPTVTLDSRYLLLTGSLADVSDHSHTVLTDIGSNTHSQVDTHLAGTLAAHASTTSAQLADVISDETGSGSLVFSTTPTFTGLVTIIPSAAAVKGLIVKGVASQSANLQEWHNSSSTVLGGVSFAGHLAAGTSPHASRMFYADYTSTDLSVTLVTTYANMTLGASGAGNSSKTFYGYYGVCQSSAAYDGNITGTLYGIYGVGTHNGTGTLSKVYGLAFSINNKSTGTITNGMACYLIAADNSGGGTITNCYGLYVGDQSVGSSKNYAIYTNSGLVHFGDSVDLASGKNITLIAGNLITDTSTGTKIGTATNQKLSFYNSTPIVQPVATTDLGTVLSDLGLRSAGTAYPITTSGAVQFTGGLTVSTVGVTITDVNFSLGTTTGTKIATATSQKLGFWNATPIVQPTTSISSAILICNEGTPITDLDTFDGYTLQKVVKALRNVGILA